LAKSSDNPYEDTFGLVTGIKRPINMDEHKRVTGLFEGGAVAFGEALNVKTF